MALTPHQEERLDDSLRILLSEEGKLKSNGRLVIKGSAGVGKTFLSETLVNSLIPCSYGLIYCSAPTNKAVGVLQSKINIKNNRISFLTCHQGLKIRARIDNKSKTKVFEPQVHEKYPPLKGVKIWVIDEASMISLQMLIWIEEHAKRQGVTVIFLGDDKQLNPVGEEDSPVFLGKPYIFSTEVEAIDFANTLDEYHITPYQINNEKVYIVLEPYPTVELTEIVRQGAGNPIIPLSRNLKAIWEYETRKTEEGHGFVYTYDVEKVIDELAAVNGTDDLKYLAWSNSEVDTMNVKVRQRIYGNPAKIELGETMVFDEPYGDYYTNQELKVEKLDIVDLEYNLTLEDAGFGNTVRETKVLKTYIINGALIDEWGDGRPVWKGIFVIHEESEQAFQTVMKQIKMNVKYNLLKYTDQVAFEGKFARLKYNHAITIHKSQGSTYRRAILNVRNANLNSNIKEKDRLFYTGVTRASELLILYNV